MTATSCIVFPAPGIITDLLVEDMKKAVGVDLSDFNPVILTEQLPYFLHQRADAPWGDKLEDLIKYAKENPETVRYISGGPGAGPGRGDASGTSTSSASP